LEHIASEVRQVDPATANHDGALAHRHVDLVLCEHVQVVLLLEPLSHQLRGIAQPVAACRRSLHRARRQAQDRFERAVAQSDSEKRIRLVQLSVARGCDEAFDFGQHLDLTHCNVHHRVFAPSKRASVELNRMLALNEVLGRLAVGLVGGIRKPSRDRHGILGTHLRNGQGRAEQEAVIEVGGRVVDAFVRRRSFDERKLADDVARLVELDLKARQQVVGDVDQLSGARLEDAGEKFGFEHVMHSGS
jgi:hypothetical protein